ncbi:MAG: hypothetical protein IT429_08810 [Gemmataceae bacterium]|nr:hypothetical protein [Gemmataceae bacterium]
MGSANRVLNLLDWADDGPLLRFSWADDRDYFGERIWEHTTPGEPIVSWYNETLLPLARTRRSALTTAEVIRSLAGRAAAAMIPAAGIDWLGLALYAHRCHRQALGQLFVRAPAECQAACLATDVLATTLEGIWDRVARAVDAELGSAA